MNQINPVQQAGRAKRAHVFNGPKDKPDKQCWCGKWHYRCACGKDCTEGSDYGPAHESEGETRCHSCYCKWAHAKHLIEEAAPDLLAACVACLNAAPSLDHEPAGRITRAAIAKAKGGQP